MSPFFRGLGGSRNLTPDAPVNLLLVLCEAENGGSRFHSSLAPERQGECHHCVTLYSLSALKSEELQPHRRKEAIFLQGRDLKTVMSDS